MSGTRDLYDTSADKWSRQEQLLLKQLELLRYELSFLSLLFSLFTHNRKCYNVSMSIK